MVQLQRLAKEDAKSLALIANNKKIWDQVRDYFPHPYNESDALDFIGMVEKEVPESNFGIFYNSDLAGVIGLVPQSDVYKKSAEIGYWIGEPFWGKGIATKAIALISDYGFNKLDLHRLYAGVFSFNEASMKVLLNNGFQKEGILRKAAFKNNIFVDEHRFAKLKS